MNLDSLTKRINRKLGCEILSQDDVLHFWDKATDVLSKEGIVLSKETSKIFKKKWIQCRVKQITELWPEYIKLGDKSLRVDTDDLFKAGKEDEDRLIKQIRDEIKRNKEDEQS